MSDEAINHIISVFELTLKEILSRIIKISQCQAVSIRLQEKDDYPYHLYEGLPDFFVLKENSLLAKDDKGDVIRDNDGSPILECMCGNVIKGHFNPKFPFFSQNGSFWTNNTTQLLSSITEEQREFIGSTRNLCNFSGYESVALIPIITGEAILGLIHLTDPRENMFNIERIEELERAAVESALIIQRAKEIMQKLNEIDKMILKSKI